MIAAAVPTPESLFHAQYQYMAQAFMHYHTVQAQRMMQELSPNQTTLCANSDLTMVAKVGVESYLTNPCFRIETCLDSL